MTNTVYVELDDCPMMDEVGYLMEILPNHCTVRIQNGNLAVDVHDSRDAVDEITNILSDRGVPAYVYAPELKIESLPSFARPITSWGDKRHPLS